MHKTREEWLNRVGDLMAEWFADLGYPLPKWRAAVGFPSTGKRGRAIGECWDASCSGDSTHEILIRPDRDDALEVAAILAHELTHAAVGIAAGHGAKFGKVARAIGLAGKLTATTAGPDFIARVSTILDLAGPLPHARLGWGESTGPKKQGTRLIKCECPECGYIARVARRWIDEVGAPLCPVHGPMVADLPEDEGELPEVPEEYRAG